MRTAVLGAILTLSVGGSVGGLAGCKGDQGLGDEGDPCNSNADCKPGLECVFSGGVGTCHRTGTGIDARMADAAVDAPPAIPPSTTLVMRPLASTQSTTATFTFSSNQSPVTFECRIDGGSFAACPTPQTYNGLAEGSHTFEVRAKNEDGLVDPTPESYTWEVDNTAPNTTITSGPSGDISVSEVAYQFTCDDAPCTFECRIDAAAFAACDPGDSFGGLTLGAHTFEVRAIDAAGNVDATPDSRTFTVLIVGPETVITDAPPASTNQTTATFSFKCVLAGVDSTCTFVCSLDGATATPCTSPQMYPGLAAGPHTFTVRGTTDPGGLADPTAAQHDWTIDLTPPVVTILTGPANGETTGRQVSFTYSADSPVVLFECAIDGTFEECSADGVTYLSLTGGEHTFSVRATDAAGNPSAPATRTFTVDAEGPIVTITSPGSISGPNGTLTFTATDASPPITTRCSVNGSSFVDCESGLMFTNLPGGPVALVIEATDRFGNVSMTTLNVTIDDVGPNVTILSPQTGEATAADGTVTFNADGDAVRFECTIDGTDVPCSGSSFNFANLLTGIHTATVTAFDEFDNPSPLPGMVTWEVDADPPIVEISSPANGATVCPTVTVVFDTVPPEDIVTYQCATDAGSFGPCDEPSVTVTLQPGTHTVRIVATDAVGNVSEAEATVTFNVDAPPTFSITSPADTRPTPSSGGSGTITLSPIETDTIVTSCLIDGDIDCCVEGCSPSTLGFFGLSDANNPHTMTVTEINQCEQSSSVSVTWNVDTSAPQVQTLTATNTTAGDGLASFTGTLSDASTITHIFSRLDRGTAVDRGGGTLVVVPVTALAAGEHVFEVWAEDQWGNSGAASPEAAPVTPHARAFTTESYLPNTGRLVVLGHDYGATPNADLVALIGNAVNLVPFRQIPVALGRPIKVVGFNAGSVNATERANALAAITTRLAALGMTWSSTNDFVEFTGTTDVALQEALFARDVLLVFDQNSSSRGAMSTIGAAWHDRLQTFLNAGGVVLVLDGRLADNTTPSGTVDIVAATTAPLLDAFAQADPLLTPPDVTPLAADSPVRQSVADSYTQQVNTVGIDITADTQQPSNVYMAELNCPQSECFEEGATVVDKIFPAYTLGATVSTAPSGVHCPSGTITLSVSPSSGAGFPSGSTYQCQLDNNTPTTCAPGGTINYTSGQFVFSHDFSFKLTDDAHGNPGRFLDTGFGVDNEGVFPVTIFLGLCSSQNQTCQHPNDFTCDTTGQICGAFVCCQNRSKGAMGEIFFHATNFEPAGATFMCQFDSGPITECRNAAGALCTFPYDDCSVAYNLSCNAPHTLHITGRDECFTSGGATITQDFAFNTVCIQ